jgi:hypothetical protein
MKVKYKVLKIVCTIIIWEEIFFFSENKSYFRTSKIIIFREKIWGENKIATNILFE